MTKRTGIRWARTCAILAAGAGGAMALLQQVTVSAGIGGAIVAGALAAQYAGYAKMRPVIGRATAMAAVALAGGLVFMAVATTSPVCPVIGAVNRCTTPQVGAITMTGVMVPVVYLSATMLVVTALTVTGRTGRGAWRLGRRLTGAEKRFVADKAMSDDVADALTHPERALRRRNHKGAPGRP